MVQSGQISIERIVGKQIGYRELFERGRGNGWAASDPSQVSFCDSLGDELDVDSGTRFIGVCHVIGGALI